jgi:serine/threonine protein kinase
MAPEQLRGDTVDARTDIHAAGMVIHEMATGQRPFREDTAPRQRLISAPGCGQPVSQHNGDLD